MEIKEITKEKVTVDNIFDILREVKRRNEKGITLNKEQRIILGRFLEESGFEIMNGKFFGIKIL